MDSVPPGLAAAIAVRSGGVPFFTEELVRTLHSGGALVLHEGRVEWDVDGVSVPSTLERLLTAQLDELAPQERRLVQAMAVAAEPVNAPPGRGAE